MNNRRYVICDCDAIAVSCLTTSDKLTEPLANVVSDCFICRAPTIDIATSVTMAIISHTLFRCTGGEVRNLAFVMGGCSRVLWAHVQYWCCKLLYFLETKWKYDRLILNNCLLLMSHASVWNEYICICVHVISVFYVCSLLCEQLQTLLKFKFCLMIHYENRLYLS